MLLRETKNDDFLTVGPCYMPGLMLTEALLGEMPAPWEVRFEGTSHSFPIEFYNRSTKELSREDPRLPPLSPEWERMERVSPGDGRLLFEEFRFAFQEFRNKVTGEIISHDPRMSPEALRQRGVKLETFRLV